MKNTWGIESLDGIQKLLVPESLFGISISILGNAFLQCVSCANHEFVCT